ncbi:RNA polymerase sigma factor [Nonomuraea sp. NEAU-A123]|uniref:RNA polymerase sigma factor n=1 Tax=Nonomuraea sp. NEAU-A123 TaxID=2839649 RepID=UPI001BE42231|nr:RNA polymerase sigma factor [Nonomuraea sp. NEAU-A123]MBT2226456.1 RNA polymerase sigma factor [Nonomuraea sp. NEAU-A123]
MNEPHLADPPGDAPPSQDDAVVIERSWDEPERFGAVFDAHYAEIHRYVSRRLGPHAADDVCAETFALAFRQRRRYDTSHRSARPWLYGIATNHISRYRRDEVPAGCWATGRSWTLAGTTPSPPFPMGPSGRKPEDEAGTRGRRARLLNGRSSGAGRRCGHAAKDG